MRSLEFYVDLFFFYKVLKREIYTYIILRFFIVFVFSWMCDFEEILFFLMMFLRI